MKKTVVLIMLITVISKILGFIREVVLSYYFGATNITDAYLISKTIPSFMFMLIGTAIMTGFIPKYTKIEQDYGIKEAEDFTNNLINVLFIISTLIIIVIWLFPIQTVKLFASGFSGETLEIAIRFTRISIFTIYFSFLIYIFSGLLQLKGIYFITAFIGIPLNLITIVSIILSYETNVILILAIGYVISIIAQFLFIIPAIRKSGFRYHKYLNFKDEKLKSFFLLVTPTIFGVSVNQINVLIDRTLASKITIGGISSLTYANQLNLFIQGIFVLSLVTVIYPVLSNMIVKKNYSSFKQMLNNTIESINLLVIPATVIFMLFSEPVVRLLFGRGAFNSEAIIMTSNALFYYAIGTIGFGLREILSRAFYSMQDTKTPMINASIGVILNIIFNIILSKYLGIGGLALATSLAAIFTTGLMFISLHKKIGSFGLRKISISFFKILLASILMGLFLKLSYNYFVRILNLSYSLLLTILIGIVIYFVLIYCLKVNGFKVIVKEIIEKFRK